MNSDELARRAAASVVRSGVVCDPLKLMHNYFAGTYPNAEAEMVSANAVLIGILEAVPVEERMLTERCALSIVKQSDMALSDMLRSRQ